MWVQKSENIRCERYYIWYLATCSCENGKYLVSIIGDSIITCDEIIEIINFYIKNLT